MSELKEIKIKELKIYDPSVDEFVELNQSKLNETNRAIQLLAGIRWVTQMINQLSVTESNSKDTWEKLNKISTILHD